MSSISRKKFIATTVMAAAGLPFGLNAIARGENRETPAPDYPPVNIQPAEKMKICIFSKHLHWLNYEDMAALAAELGFDGVDLTVRPEGHVLPERATEDMPKAVAAVEKAGLKVYMITTGIKNAGEQHAADIIKTAAATGIKYYRTGWYDYDKNAGIPANIDLVHKQMSGLADLNKQFRITGAYQNHAGELFGASLWDLWLALKGIDTAFMGCQFDIRHATCEGADTWNRGLELLQPHIRTINVKDFYWEKKGGKWQTTNVPLGEGMVDFKKYFGLVKQYGIPGPVCLHYEYELGGAQDGAKKLSIPKDEFIRVVKKDLATLKRMLEESGL
ncbi:sugar phosphate isomerase/epimerase [soil metagenome]|jgi:sugar phosphate isomerase/epimerase